MTCVKPLTGTRSTAPGYDRVSEIPSERLYSQFAKRRGTTDARTVNFAGHCSDDFLMPAGFDCTMIPWLWFVFIIAPATPKN